MPVMQGTWLALSVEQATLDLGFVSSSPMLSIEFERKMLVIDSFSLCYYWKLLLIEELCFLQITMIFSSHKWFKERYI